jgi:hypothetical protein
MLPVILNAGVDSVNHAVTDQLVGIFGRAHGLIGFDFDG